jgi:hypothetical protein
LVAVLAGVGTPVPLKLDLQPAIGFHFGYKGIMDKVVVRPGVFFRSKKTRDHFFVPPVVHRRRVITVGYLSDWDS